MSPPTASRWKEPACSINGSLPTRIAAVGASEGIRADSRLYTNDTCTPFPRSVSPSDRRVAITRDIALSFTGIERLPRKSTEQGFGEFLVSRSASSLLATMAAGIGHMGTGKRRRKACRPATTPIRPEAERNDREAESAHATLNQLTPEERMVCLWKRLGFSSREIASAQPLSTGTAGTLLRAALAKIRR
jgi:DNA-binding CsgD family transcriptional regulator